MEIQIDTTIIQTSSTKIEELINNEITNNPLLNSGTTQSKEYYRVQVNSFLLENESGLIVNGRITEVNQTFYEYDINDNVVILVRNKETVNIFLKDIIASIKTNRNLQYEFTFSIDGNLFYNIDTITKNEMILPMIFFNVSIKLYFGFLSKFKFNKWDSVLINSGNYTECYLISKILNIIGYDLTVNKSVLTKDQELNDQWDIDAYNKIKFFEWDSNVSQFNKFTHIIDTTGELFTAKNKLYTFLLLRQNGSLHLIDIKPNEAQLTPCDLQILYDKNISINLTKSENCIRFNYTIGRELNYLREIFEKLSKSYQPHVKLILQKLECRIWDLKENLSELTLLELNKSYMNMCILI